MSHGQLPNLIIAGVSRSGTTSLFWWLAQHPAICRSDVKEVRYFSAIRHGRPLAPIEEYTAHFRHRDGEPFALEASPAYAYGGRPVADAIADLLDEPRIIISLRDPVERFVSFYSFMRSRLAIPADMDRGSYLRHCEELALTGRDRQRQNFPYFALTTGVYVDFVDDWIDVFGDHLRIVFFDDLVADARATVRGLAGWLSIDADVVDAFELAVENRTVSIRNAGLQQAALAANRRFGRFFGRHRSLKRNLRQLYYSLNAQRSPAPAAPPVDDDLVHLRSVYAEPNERLAQVLRSHGYRDLPAWLPSPRRPSPTTVATDGR